jgi:hypothetical protein
MLATEAYKKATDLVRKYPFLDVKASPGRFVDGWTIFVKHSESSRGVAIEIARLMFTGTEVDDFERGLDALVIAMNEGE